MSDFEQIYPVLRRLAERALKNHHGTLQPTALVHEAWLKLSNSSQSFVDRTHFLAVAATAIRQILVDHVRARQAARRGGDLERVTLDGLQARHTPPWELLAVDQVLASLHEQDPRQARIVELRVFGGLENTEIAEALDVSLSTVEREWRRARAWVASRLGAGVTAS